MPSQYKESREQCYSARDKYWQCLEANNEMSEKCQKFRKEYEKMCSKQWVKHFDRRRKYEKFKEFADSQNWEVPRRKEEENK